MAKSKRERRRIARATFPYYVVSKSEKTMLTNENWSPTIDGMVKVYLHEYRNGGCRVSVWGHDDFWMGKEMTSIPAAVREFDRIVNLTTQDELLSRGFKEF